MVVGVREYLPLVRHLPTAVAALGEDVARYVGVRTELARHAGTPFATLLLARRVPDVALLPTRRRQRRVRRGLRRLAATTLELGDACEQRTDMFEELLILLGERVDPRHQGQHQPLQAFGVERIDLLRWHPEGESDRPPGFNASLVSHTDAGGEQLPFG